MTPGTTLCTAGTAQCHVGQILHSERGSGAGSVNLTQDVHVEALMMHHDV